MRTPTSRKSSPRRVSPKRLKALGGKPPYSTIKKRPRKPSETLRIYGGKKRIEFVKSLPCSACGVVGYSENAHVLGNGGMSRKADYQTIAPLCGARFVAPDDFILRTGCHTMFDRFRSDFDVRFPKFNAERAAAWCQTLWQADLAGDEP